MYPLLVAIVVEMVVGTIRGGIMVVERVAVFAALAAPAAAAKAAVVAVVCCSERCDGALSESLRSETLNPKRFQP